MSGSNGLAISLDELERLIRLLGMLGSDFDAEVLAAARQAQRWVLEKRTDWRTLLTPDPEAGVTSVTAAADPEALEAARIRDRAQAFDLGYQEGLKQGLAKAMAQVKAQAQAAQYGSVPSSAWTNAARMGLGAAQKPASGSGAAGGCPAGPVGQGPVRPPAAPPGGYPPSSWQAVCQELLDRDDAGVPGVLRSRERQFVSDVLARGFPTLTAAQEHWLRDIAGRNHMSW